MTDGVARMGLWKLPQPWKSIEGGLRQLSLYGFPPLFEKASAKNASAFSQLPQARRRISHQSSGNKKQLNTAFIKTLRCNLCLRTTVTHVPEPNTASGGDFAFRLFAAKE